MGWRLFYVTMLLCGYGYAFGYINYHVIYFSMLTMTIFMITIMILLIKKYRELIIYYQIVIIINFMLELTIIQICFTIIYASIRSKTKYFSYSLIPYYAFIFFNFICFDKKYFETIFWITFCKNILRIFLVIFLQIFFSIVEFRSK
jgi:hypothetical protein